MSANKTNSDSGSSIPGNILRFRAGIIIVALQWILRFIVPSIFPDFMVIGVFAGFAGGLALMVWWVFFSRAGKPERWGGLILIIASLILASFFLDESIATANMGLMFAIYSVPVVSLLFILWAVFCYHMKAAPRRISMVLTILVASGMWIFLRTDGMDGNANHILRWRWAPTHEELMMAREQEVLSAVPAAVSGEEAVWPGFRGPGRDGVVKGSRIATDWTLSPPEELWRREVGPGCSSFAVKGDLLFTQEQLGDFELVSCYRLQTGEPVWVHRDSARFYDSHAGPGPRSTPTIEGDVVYTLGATGILNALDIRDGSLIWSRNAAEDTGAKIQTWGCTGSPLVMDERVIVSVSGELAAYNIVNGETEWKGPSGATGYCSPHHVTVDGTDQVILMSNKGATSFDPPSGAVLWEYEWPVDERILQPALLDNNDLLLVGELKGVRRVGISREADGWKQEERWESSEMSLNFNDVVIHNNHMYGFDGPSLACMDLADGRLLWKGNRYRGWLLLLEDQDLLLVLSEKGELALVEASPEKFTELARIQAIKGKTWNHPAMAGDILLVRNAIEMAAYRLGGSENSNSE